LKQQRLYIDEDPPEALSKELRALGHDAVNTRELGYKGRHDPWQLAFAALERRIFVTCNFRDFAMLHEAWLLWSGEWRLAPKTAHSGVVVLPNDGRTLLPMLVQLVQEVANLEQSLENRLLYWRRGSGWNEIVIEHPLPARGSETR
jgi:hypothetical protein